MKDSEPQPGEGVKAVHIQKDALAVDLISGRMPEGKTFGASTTPLRRCLAGVVP